MLVPFVIILLIPLSPPGHMLVFSLIVKVYPDFVPTPFTEHRQNAPRYELEARRPELDRLRYAGFPSFSFILPIKGLQHK